METNTKPHVSFGTKITAYIFLNVIKLKPFQKYQHYFFGDNPDLEKNKEKAKFKNIFTK